MQCLTEAFGGLCAYCPNPATNWDHVVAVSRGGQTVPGNVLPSCRSCNSSKRTRDLLDWVERTGRTLQLRTVEYLALFMTLEI